MAEQKKYTGGCHCGKFRYEVTTDLSMVVDCNCSVCMKKGMLLTFVPPEQFKLVSGEEAALKDYQFNKKVIHHLFCPNCGVQSFGTGPTPDGRKMYAINVCCLDGVEISTLKLTPFDGRNM
jgi:hypothetical protein